MQFYPTLSLCTNCWTLLTLSESKKGKGTMIWKLNHFIYNTDFTIQFQLARSSASIMMSNANIIYGISFQWWRQSNERQPTKLRNKLRIYYMLCLLGKHLNSSASRLFIHQFVQVDIKGNIKAPQLGPLCGESTGDQWIPCANGQ